MSNQNLKRMVEADDKEMYKANNALARLIRTIISDLDIDYPQISNAIDTYVEKENSKRPRHEKSSVKSNLVGAITSSSVSFKYFTRFLSVLKPKKVVFTVKLVWDDRGHESTHQVTMDMVDDSAVSNRNKKPEQ